MSFDATKKVFSSLDASLEISKKSSSWDDVRATIRHEATCDLDEVRRAIPVLFAPGELHELRALPSGRGQIIGTDALDSACEAVQAVSGQTVYYSLNPVRSGADRANASTVLHRRWFFIDIDPVRPADTSATDAEKDAASEVMSAVLGYLAEQGWPMPVLIDSGNGFHLLYRIDLPADDLTHQILKECLEHLISRWNAPGATIDNAVHDAPRIAKMPGTWARKGIPTDVRPHRICKILCNPVPLNIVPIEKIQALSQFSVSKKNEDVATTWDDVTAKGGLASYIRSAVEREGYRILSATEGTRNNILNRAAFSLGTMASWPEMHAEKAKAQLVRDGERAGLTPRECLLTVNSGWTAGEKEPRTRPSDPQRNGKHETRIDPNESLTEGLDEITPEKVDWLYENRIAPGFIAIFAGRTGMGKSFVVCDLVARLSRGESLPFSSIVHPPIRTLFISEDSPRKVIGPRLLELKAVKPMVRFMKFKAMGEYTLANTEMLDKAYRESGNPGLVVIDPPANFLGEVDEHRNAEVRKVLFILIEWLEKRCVSCVLIMHINKQIGKGLDAVERILGSVGWGSSARMTVAFVKDPDNPGQFICGGTKNNLGEVAEALTYKIVKTDTLAKIEWIGKTSTSMEDAMNAVKKKSKGADAVEWLIGLFRQRNEWESDELRRMARDVGVTKYALFESPEVLALPIKKRKRINANGEQYWVWIADPGWPAGKSEPSEPRDVNSSGKTDSEIPTQPLTYRKYDPY